LGDGDPMTAMVVSSCARILNPCTVFWMQNKLNRSVFQAFILARTKFGKMI